MPRRLNFEFTCIRLQVRILVIVQLAKIVKEDEPRISNA